jgi:hypothetical protein
MGLSDLSREIFSALLYPDLLAGCEGFNAEAQGFAESRREVLFSAFLRVSLRLCVKTGLASALGLGRAVAFAPLRLNGAFFDRIVTA